MTEFYYQNFEGIHPGSPEIFTKLTGAEWADEMQFPDGKENITISPPGKSDYEMLRFLVPAYAAYRKKRPKLYIRPGRGGHSVHAYEHIAKGTIVTEYLGEWKAGASAKTSGYRWGAIDGLRIRNLGGMVEDGFPNLVAFHIYNIDDVPLRVIFVAVEDIHEGSMVAIDYGMNHSVKLQYHDEYRSEEMISFFMRNPLKKIFFRIKELQSRPVRELGWGRTLELESLTAKVRYLFQTPSALLLLLLKKTLCSEDILKHYGDPEYRYFILGFPVKQNDRQREINANLEQTLCYFNTKSSDLEFIEKIYQRVRQRVFHKVILKTLLKEEESVDLEREAFIWNSAYDAVQQANKEALVLNFELALQKQTLLSESLFYAREINSPLVPWLENLT